MATVQAVYIEPCASPQPWLATRPVSQGYFKIMSYTSEYRRKYKKRNRKRNPAQARHGIDKLLNNELLPEDAFVFLGKDIDAKRFRFYMKAIK